MSGVHLHDSSGRLSATLRHVSLSLPSGMVSLRKLLELIGEQGMLLVCAFLSLPFLLPVSIPGVSTVFGLGMLCIGVGVTLNRVPWLPRRLLDRPLPTGALKQVFEQSARVVGRFERLVRPRWLLLTRTTTANAVHGLALMLGAGLLMVPLGLVPFSNTLPAVAVLLLSLGMLERDGLFIAAGYVMNLATIFYFGVLAAGVLMAGGGILTLVGG